MAQPSNRRLVTEEKANATYGRTKTVNGQAPDENGNVTVAAGAPTDAELATAVATGTTKAALDASYVRPTILSSSAFASGRKVAFDGDSITAGTGSSNASVDSYVAYISKILGTALVPTDGPNGRINGGIAGNTAGQVLARMDGIIAQNPDAHVVFVGQNASTNIATFIADTTAIVAKIKASGKPLVLVTVTPRTSAAAASDHERINTYNLWLRAFANKNSIPLADAHAALVDPATGYMNEVYKGTDTTHPGPAGHLVIAQTIAPVLKSILPPASPFPFVFPGAPGLIANPLMAGGSASTAPTSWSDAQWNGTTRSLSTEAPEAGDVLPGGLWFKQTVDASAASSTHTTVRYASITGTHAVGDTLLAVAAAKSGQADGSGVKITVASGATDFITVCDQVGVAKPGLFMRSFTIGSGQDTNLRVRFSTSAAAGLVRTGYAGSVQVWNLTQLGLAGIVG